MPGKPGSEQKRALMKAFHVSVLQDAALGEMMAAEVSKLLARSSAEFTLDIHAHVTEVMERGPADQTAGLLEKPDPRVVSERVTLSNV